MHTFNIQLLTVNLIDFMKLILFALLCMHVWTAEVKEACMDVARF